jgi:hypothetical protein
MMAQQFRHINDRVRLGVIAQEQDYFPVQPLL